MLYFETFGYGYSKKLCKNIVIWFVSKYLPRYKLDIGIVHRGMKREKSFGYCDILGSTYKPREFLIELDTYMDKETYIKTLLHELYHLKDFCLGNLKVRASKRYYRGECVECLPYWDQPHEIIAHEQENVLYQEYLTDRQLSL